MSNKDNGLFRKEVVNNRAQDVFGQVFVASPIGSKTITSVSVIILVSLVIFLSLADYTRKSRVSGYLVTDSKIAHLSPPISGVIGKVHIADGDTVSKGEPLFEVFSDNFLSNGERYTTIIQKNIHQKIVSVENLIETERALFNAAYEEKIRLIAAKEKSLETLTELLDVASETAEIAEKKYLNAEKVFGRKLISEAELDNAKSEKLTQITYVKQLQRDLIIERKQLESMRTEHERMPLELKKREENTLMSLRELESELASVTAQSHLIVKAPFDGTVTSFKTNAGDLVEANQPLVSLLPSNAQLYAQLLVPSNASGFIKIGDELNLRYDAFPYQKFGTFQAQISQINNNLLMPDDHRLKGLVASPVYLVDAQIAESKVGAYGSEFSLKPGLFFDADIHHEERSLMSWLFDPILSAKQKL